MSHKITEPIGFKGTPGKWEPNPVETYHNDIGVLSPLIKDDVTMPYGFNFTGVCRLEPKWKEDKSYNKEEVLANEKITTASKKMAIALQYGEQICGKFLAFPTEDELKQFMILATEALREAGL
jgi:hypothetical protein